MSLSFASVLLFSSFLVTPCFLVPCWLAWSELSVKKKAVAFVLHPTISAFFVIVFNKFFKVLCPIGLETLPDYLMASSSMMFAVHVASHAIPLHLFLSSNAR